MFFFLLDPEKQSEKPQIFSEIFMGGTFSKETSVRKHSIFVVYEEGEQTLPGGFVQKKAHCNKLNKMSFSKIPL